MMVMDVDPAVVEARKEMVCFVPRVRNEASLAKVPGRHVLHPSHANPTMHPRVVLANVLLPDLASLVEDMLLMIFKRIDRSIDIG
mmetsp:Transcript_33866/g.50226  ORF Transcript_33866/g.50226 Transcript_33866/m.50226 type:complete len:85 (-) Transcript_33866:389-643(-)